MNLYRLNATVIVLVLALRADRTFGQKLYWTDLTAQKIQRANLDGSAVEDVVVNQLDFVSGLAIDPVNEHLYWSDNAWRIRRAPLSGGASEVFVDMTDFAAPRGIAVDWVGGKVYWAASSLQRIQRCNLDGTQLEDFISSQTGVWHIAILPSDPPKLFWHAGSAIRSASLTDPVVEDNLTWSSVTGLAVDGSAGRLYWTSFDQVWRSNLNGSEVVELFDGQTYSPGHLIFNVLDGFLYWSDQQTDSVYRADPNDPLGQPEVVADSLNNPEAIAIQGASGPLFVAQRDPWTSAYSLGRVSAGEHTVEPFFHDGLSAPFTLAIDSTRNAVVWNEVAGRGRIQRCDLSGANCQFIIPAKQFWAFGLALDAGAGKLYWSNFSGQRIQRSNLDGSELEHIVTTGLMRPQGIVLHSESGKLYWADSDLGKIQRANSDGSQVEDVLAELESPTQVAIDSEAGRLYWANYNIYQANLDGTEVEMLIDATTADFALDLSSQTVYWIDYGDDVVRRRSLSGGEVENLAAATFGRINTIAVDTLNGKLYWSEDQANQFDLWKIYRANLDGSGVEEFMVSSGNYPVQVAIDPSAGKLYWSASPTIWRVNLDGSAIENLDPARHVYPFALATDDTNGHLYWTSNISVPSLDIHGIQRSDGEGQGIETLISSGLSSPWSIALDPLEQRMYWSDSAAKKIQRATLLGTEVEDVFDTSPWAPGIIALDRAGGQIYWTAATGDVHTHAIFRGATDGGESQMIVDQGLVAPVSLALDIERGKIYWSDDGATGPARDGTIQRANLDGTEVELVVADLVNPIGMAINLAPHIMASDPPECAIDARQPHAINDPSVRFGWDSLVLSFSNVLPSVAPGDFAVTQIGGEGVAPVVTLTEMIAPSLTRVTLSEPVAPQSWTCVMHLPSGTDVCWASLPGDVNADGTASPIDVLRLIDHLNAVVQPPYSLWQTDVNHSGLAEPSDILRVIDLLNGAGAFDVWNGRSLPTCP